MYSQPYFIILCNKEKFTRPWMHHHRCVEESSATILAFWCLSIDSERHLYLSRSIKFGVEISDL